MDIGPPSESHPWAEAYRASRHSLPGGRLAQTHVGQLVEQIGVVGQRQGTVTQQQVQRRGEASDRGGREGELLDTPAAVGQSLRQAGRLPGVDDDRGPKRCRRLQGHSSTSASSTVLAFDPCQTSMRSRTTRWPARGLRRSSWRACSRAKRLTGSGSYQLPRVGPSASMSSARPPHPGVRLGVGDDADGAVVRQPEVEADHVILVGLRRQGPVEQHAGAQVVE
jgi:hypothetical protein